MRPPVSSQAVAAFTVVSRVTGKTAVVSKTANPLVALYSAPACSSGTLTVQFRPATGSTGWQAMPPQTCVAGRSVNALVAGMRPSTMYVLEDVVTSGSASTTSSPLDFTTGKPPANLQIDQFAVKRAPTSQAEQSVPLLFHELNPAPTPLLANPLATDLSGNLVWYYNPAQAGLTLVWPTHVMADGTFLVLGRDKYRTTGDNVLRLVDLAGTTLRETNIDAVNAQLAARGNEPIYAFHHDATQLPNGYTAVLGENQKNAGGRDVMGDMIVVLDTNFQVVWTWDAFDHFTPSPQIPAMLTCAMDYPNTLCALPDPKSIDWSHANDVAWSVTDNDLTVSLRNIDAVAKIDYQNGHGSGKVLWVLGPHGNFKLDTGAASDWPTHSHDGHLLNATTFVNFDNGNVRCGNGQVKGCHSRGQVLTLNQTTHTVTRVVNYDLGTFWQALGSATILGNGNAFFAGGFAAPSEETEFLPNGVSVFQLQSVRAEFRAYRLSTL